MDYVPDTSVIVDGRFTAFVAKKKGSRVILAEAMLAEVENQANEGRSIGFAAIQELKTLREMEKAGKISIDIYGRRPSEWQIRKARAGEIDEVIRNVASENDATLVTGDHVQRDLGTVKGLRVHFLEPPEIKLRNIEDFFDPLTTSVHLKEGLKPVIKTGKPGSVRLVELDEVLHYEDLENIAGNLIKRGKIEGESFIEMDMHGATVIQLKQIRVVITRPPFSDSLEITAVRPIVKLTMDEYQPDEELMGRLKASAHGILVAGAPGAGKSTFVQALAEFYADMGNIVKTMEKPRDLQVKKDITQYTGLEGSMEKTGDILLLVRTDYTIFDEMRVTSDFHVYTDLRLSGVGMVGVVHATRPIDALQRFIGRIELGLIPQVIDTIIFIENGGIGSILTTKYMVKVPSGMSQEDLARPVIEVSDFKSGKLLYEIYTFGEQIVVVPVAREGRSVSRLAEQKIREEISRRVGGRPVEVKMMSDSRVLVRVGEDDIPKLIGRRGYNISELEKFLGVKIDVEPLASTINSRTKADIEIKNKILYIYVGVPNRNVKLYVDEILVLQARSSSRGIVRIRISSDTGSAIYSAIKSGKNIEYLIGE